MAENKNLCLTCEKSVWCSTWTEVKCTHFKKRIYNHAELTTCVGYKKRSKNFVESKCQCEDCLKNDVLVEGYEEE